MGWREGVDSSRVTFTLVHVQTVILYIVTASYGHLLRRLFPLNLLVHPQF